MSEWNPNMDEAPRDGTTIRLRVPEVVYRAYWDADMKAWIITREITVNRVYSATHWKPDGGG